jgi:hypothetical protein
MTSLQRFERQRATVVSPENVAVVAVVGCNSSAEVVVLSFAALSKNIPFETLIIVTIFLLTHQAVGRTGTGNFPGRCQ